jgi:hypothetical protein
VTPARRAIEEGLKKFREAVRHNLAAGPDKSGDVHEALTSAILCGETGLHFARRGEGESEEVRRGREWLRSMRVRLKD